MAFTAAQNNRIDYTRIAAYNPACHHVCGDVCHACPVSAAV